MAALFDFAEQAFGPVGVLVNNAGMMKLGAIADCEDDAFDRQVALNLGAVFRGMREAAAACRWGASSTSRRASSASTSRVTALCSDQGRGRGADVYSRQGTRAARHHRQCGRPPDPVATELFLDGKSDAQIAAIARMNPFGRFGEPEDIARVVAFLAGGDAGWVNGQVIRANGGVI